MELVKKEVGRLTVSDLEYFLQVARLGSIREVARANDIEPAQLSRIMKRFEQRSGRKLFTRSSRGIGLTPEGANVRQSVEKALGELALLGDRPERQKPRNSFALRGIGASPYLSQFVVSR